MPERQQTEKPHQTPTAMQGDTTSHRYRSTATRLTQALDSIARYFQELQQQRPKAETIAEPTSVSHRSILKNKQAVHTEDIWRASSEEDSEESAALNKVLNVEIPIEESDQNEFQHKKTRKSPGQPNRKRIVIMARPIQ